MVGKTHHNLAAILAVLILCGCGGGAGSGSSSGAIQIGEVTTEAAGHPTPLATSGSSSSGSVVGMAGALFTSLVFKPNPRISDTTIVYPDEDGVLWTYRNGATNSIVSGPFIFGSATFTHDGRIAFSMYDAQTFLNQIFTCNYDGSGVTRITSSRLQHDDVAWAPNNELIAFDDDAGNVYTCAADGSNEKLFNTTSWNPAWSPDSSTLAYVVTVAGGHNQVYAKTLGGVATLISESFGNDSCGAPSWSPDGSRIAFTVDNGSKASIYEVSPTSPGTWSEMQGSLGYDAQPAWSPDSKELVFRRASAYTDTDWSIYTADSNGSSAALISPPSEEGLGLGAAWSPFLTDRTFVGVGGALASNASGFLWGQNGNSFESMLAFQAKTSSSAKATPQPDAGNGELTWVLQADSITGLEYTNGYYFPAVQSTPNTPQVLVTFLAYNGEIDTVAPMRRTAGPVLPIVSGTKQTYRGQFTAVYDGNGHNLAPSGATELVIDGTTGKLVSAG